MRVPEGWRAVTLREVIGSLEAGVSVNSEGRQVAEGEVGVLKTSAISNGFFVASEHKAVIPQEVGRVKVPVKADRIIISRMNTSALVGASAYVDRDYHGLFLPDRLWLVDVKDRQSTHVKWLSYVLSSASMRSKISGAAAGTSGSMKNISKDRLLDLPILVPPFSEQNRIAEILSSVDEAIEATQAVIEQTRKVKGGVLDRLLTKGIGHSRFKHTEYGEIPEAWDVVPLKAVAHVQTGVAKGKKDIKDPVELPYLRVANVQDGYIDLAELKTITVSASQADRYSLRPGDVLMTEGGDFDKLGRGDVWKGQVPLCLHQNHVFAVRPDPGVLVSEFLATLTASAHGKAYFLSCAKRTTNLASINSTQVKEFPVLLPKKEEQERIVQRVAAYTEAERSASDALVQLIATKSALMADLLTGWKRISSDALSPAA